MIPDLAKVGHGRVGRPRAARPDRQRIQEFRAGLDRAGKTVSDWAIENGERADDVYKVLSGERACTTGNGHRIAVKCGIKDGDGFAVAAND